jgi:DNA-binding transcriptional MerR regulator
VEEDFPRKQLYTIGEVSRITGVRPHVLRYWESEGKIIRPNRRRSRHRRYRLEDIQLIFEIKRLRDEEKLTLAAMRRQLHPPARGSAPYPLPFPFISGGHQLAELLRDLKAELKALKDLLD